jgi:hypothetical protein
MGLVINRLSARSALPGQSSGQYAQDQEVVAPTTHGKLRKAHSAGWLCSTVLSLVVTFVLVPAELLRR